MNKRSFLGSLLLHLIVFLGVFLYIDRLPPSTRQGEKKVSVIRSYLYSNNLKQTVQHDKKETILTKEPKLQEQKTSTTLNSAPFNKITFSQTPTTEHNSDSSKNTTHSPSAQAKKSSSQGEPSNGLLALLHAAIQDNQQYPPRALQIKRQGRVMVGFTLYPNGAISNLQLIQSCGTDTLDAAALAAVRLAAPFKQVDTYLKAAEAFSIEVVFALDEENE